MLRTRLELEEIEARTLAPYAMRARESRGRRVAQAEHPMRTAFQRDRDRVIHSAAFRRLEYKTQVFVNHEGDHYRTRLTHTMEAAQITRTVARALGLNPELAEAVALSHDLGHPPFGHAGEHALNERMRPHGGFDHNAQSLRTVDWIEVRYPDFRGLNLTFEVREGIIKHSNFQSRPAAQEFDPKLYPCLEAQIVDLADEIAYLAHDTDDGIRAEMLTLDDLKKFHADFFGASNAELAVVGDFDAAEVQKLAADLFGDWKSPQPYAQIKRPWRPLQAVDQSIETPDKANSMFAAGGTFAMSENDPDYPALLFANTLIGASPRSRLWSRIREKDGLSYAVQSVFYAGVVDNFGEFLAIAIANPVNMPKVESAFKDEMGKIVSAGFTAEEVASMKKEFLEEQQVDRAEDRSLVRELARNARYGYTMARDAEIERKISALTPGEISAAVKRHLDPASLSIVKAGDFKKAGVSQ